MLSSAEAVLTATSVLITEGELLDARRWDEWLALYRENCVYRVPAWRDELTETDDPDRELSIIYHGNRRGLEERVARIKSGKSVSAYPLPRTTHFVSNVTAQVTVDGFICARASWMVRAYRPRDGHQTANFGRLETTLVAGETGTDWRYDRKIVNLVNDQIPTMIDFYLL